MASMTLLHGTMRYLRISVVFNELESVQSSSLRLYGRTPYQKEDFLKISKKKFFKQHRRICKNIVPTALTAMLE